MIFENEKAAFNLISRKKPLFDYDSLKYSQLQLDNKYCFNIHLKETPVKATLKGILSQDHPDIVLDSQLLWSDGKIRAKVYESDAIIDRFILGENIVNNLDTLEKCLLTEDLAKSMELIKKDVVAFNKENGNNDNCYLALIDTLAVKFIKTSDIQYMKILELISSIMDGYIAEFYFVEIGEKLFSGNFVGFFNYIFDKKERKDNYMEGVFVESLAIEIEDYNNKEKLNTYFNEQMDSNNFDIKQREYFGKLMKKVDEFLKNHN
jgi:hypothetical protein